MIRTKVLKDLPRARQGEGGSSKEDVSRGVMEKSWHVRVIERKEARGDEQMEYFFSKEVRSTF